MIDHTQMCVHAEDHKATVAFYEEVLKSIGYEKLLVFGPNGEYVGFGDKVMPHHQMHTDWWIVSQPEKPPKSHHAFRCKGSSYGEPRNRIVHLEIYHEYELTNMVYY